MNRPTDVGGLPRPPLALVGHRPGDGPGPHRPRDAAPGETAGRNAASPSGARPGSPSGARTGAGDAIRPGPDEAARLAAALRERTADLQRLKAEFDNYRRRVRRDRLAVGQIAVVNVLERLLPVLDAIDEAAGQDEVTGGFRRVALLLEAQLTSLGLTSVGTVGEPFDPNVHEAMTYTPVERAGRAACTEVLRQGYRVGDRLLRPAQVAVTGEPQATATGV
ncbi:GrpE protein [Streptomyces sp. NBRC 110611]|uniref:nucleotide exchange factor GrpE n=1 Tax=Streptomyces sp. NBRC 110611 TaxID=1621259 RepID=UPI0008577546|nr:nucleotide exchange factor GrpE [Streptomyces sp. NBRC 110611]GAU70842.1 GrpE protein [Streptomyces sp. NBRC 110611]